jgi:hypothetical protein
MGPKKKKEPIPLDHPVDFGLWSDYNRVVVRGLDRGFLSGLPLTQPQIDSLAPLLDWDVISRRHLSGYNIVKHQARINWPVFIRNGHRKNILALVTTRDRLRPHAAVFMTARMQARYCTEMFMSAFPELTDWAWCTRNLPIGSYVLLKYWDSLDVPAVCAHQTLDSQVFESKAGLLDWAVLCQNPNRLPMTEDFLAKYADYIHWDHLVTHYKIPQDLLEPYLTPARGHLIARHQELTEAFILTHFIHLGSWHISRYQYLSYEFIRDHLSLLNVSQLLLNPHFNQPDRPSVLTLNKQVFIIAPTPDAPVTFCLPQGKK